MARTGRGASSTTTSSSNESTSRKSCCDHVAACCESIYSTIVGFFNFIWSIIVSVGLFIGRIFEFIWYPIKEQGGWCFKSCANKRERS